MTSARLSRIHRGLIALLVTVYFVAGVVGFFVDIDKTRDLVLWVLLLWGGAALILAGALLRIVPGWLSIALVTVGATAGALALVWTVVVPLAAAVLVALTFSLTRREQTA
jgi:predicted membrane-bound mannosyltransferase